LTRPKPTGQREEPLIFFLNFYPKFISREFHHHLILVFFLVREKKKTQKGVTRSSSSSWVVHLGK
jgi:hypothetical protein